MRAAAALGIALAALSGAAAADEPAPPEQTIAALWRALSNDPGESADVATRERLFHADSVVFGARTRDGKPELRVVSGPAFVKSQAKPGEKGFYECEISRSVKVYESLAVVHSIVESRTRKDAEKPDFTGVNSIQLFRDTNGWKIVSLYYQVETPAAPAPLEGGVSGRCL